MPGDLYIILYNLRFVKDFLKKDQEFFRNFHRGFFVGGGAFDAPLPTIATVFEWVVVGADPYNADRYVVPEEGTRPSPTGSRKQQKGRVLADTPFKLY